MLLLTLLAALLPFAISEPLDVFYIKPVDYPPSLNCPHQPCFTLQQFTQENNFTTGTTLQFLPGHHTLQQTILNITSVSNITLSGGESNLTAKVICENEVTILCNNVTGLNIEGLIFQLNQTDHEQNALILSNCSDSVISNTVFQGSGDYIINTTMRAIFLKHSTAMIRNCVFEANVGGAILIKDSSTLTICGSSFTRNYGLGAGGALSVMHKTTLLHLDGSIPNHFTSNSDRYGGGAVQCNACRLEMTGENTFQDNFVLYYNSAKSLSSGRGGGLHVYYGNVSVVGTALFYHNSAYIGGAVYIEHSSGNLDGKSVFERNFAKRHGSALHVIGSRITFTGITSIKHNAVGSSDAAVRVLNGNITFSGCIRIMENAGGGMKTENSIVEFENDTLFDGNQSPNGGALNCLQGSVSFHGSTLFTHNTADRNGGALYAVGTTVHMQGTVNFTCNTASNGGGMYLETGASLILQASSPFTTRGMIYTLLYSSYNLARKYGGGIYHVDSPSSRQCDQIVEENFAKLPFCFIQVESSDLGFLSSIKISSYNDAADKDGNFLYGGLVDRCRVKSLLQQTAYTRFIQGRYLITDSQYREGKQITSKPYDLCLCDYTSYRVDLIIGDFYCQKMLSIEVYRGQKFVIPLLALAQVGTTSTLVTALTSSKAKLEIYQTSQPIPDSCHFLSYTLYSTASHEEVVLYPDGPCRDIGSAGVIINATLLPCPDGFTQFAEICICEERLQHYHVNCTIADVPYFTKDNDSSFWMGVLYTDATYRGLILAKSCPEYCKTDAVNITLDDPDFQCDLNRSGLLCGACATNYSLMLGSSQCQVCPNTYLALLLPFAAAGIVLVVFMSFLRLTVGTGILNSVILYANIVQVNKNLLFPANSRNILTVFLAWMNLDLGFQTCFYDGMDAYAQTWLQFAFPLYVWLLIALIIVISRYSITLSKLIGHNPIAVLATLLLMSYTKILKIIIEVYSSAHLDYPDNRTVTVWLKDANVPYLQSKHLFLTLVTSLVLVFFFLPYTLLLLLGHKLYRFTGRKHWGWLNRIKPLLDSYYAPYKIHTRYWTGFLLLVRCALYIVFLLNSLRTSKICLAIVLTFTGIEVTMGVIHSGRVYGKQHINILEALVYLNLIVLSAVTLAGLNTPALVYVLLTMVLLIVVILSARQLYLLYISETELWKRFEADLSRYHGQARAGAKGDTEDSTVARDSMTASHYAQENVTNTVVELREPLLESSE